MRDVSSLPGYLKWMMVRNWMMDGELDDMTKKASVL